MKFTVVEYSMILQAVLHEADKLIKESEVCKKQDSHLTAGYYASRFQAYRNLYDKICEMLDDITE